MTALWKDSMDEGGLAWDDSSNNRAFLAGTICSTLNGASIYIESTRKPDQYKTGRRQAAQGRHPARTAAGRPERPVRSSTLVQSHVMPTYSKNQKAAKDLLRFMHNKANYEQWFADGPGFYTPRHVRLGNAQGLDAESGDGAVCGRRQVRFDARTSR